MRTALSTALSTLRSMAIFILGPVLLLAPSPRGIPQNGACRDDGIGLQIVTDRSSYSPGATMHVKFLVTSVGETPLYMFRAVNRCSSPLGWLALEIRDQQNRKVQIQECSADYDMGALNVVQTLSDPLTGIQLHKNEIYRKEEIFELPQTKGTYSLRAEFAPAGLAEDQNQELSQHKMRVLRGTCSAPVISITVK